MKIGSAKACYKFFSQLSNPTRLAALEALTSRPMSVGELAAVLGQEQSMISHNLKSLLKCNFVAIEKQGKKRVYSANKETLAALFEAVAHHAEKYCPTKGRCIAGDNKSW